MHIPESHSTQINKGIRTSLLRAGIPAPLIRASLTSRNGGDALTDFVRNASKSDGAARMGSFIRLHTVKAADNELFFLTARAFHLMGVGCEVLSLARLLREVETRNYDALERHVSIPMLCITRFQEPSESPMVPYARFQIESMLLDRINGGLPIMANTVGDRSLADKWWSAGFVSRLNEVSCMLGLPS